MNRTRSGYGEPIVSRLPVGDGGFPALAVFSLLGFVVVLAAVALASLRPWEADTVDPHLSVSLGTEAVGDAVAVTPQRSSRQAVAEAVSVARATPAERVSAADGSGYVLAVAQGRPVSAAAVPYPAPPTPEPESPTLQAPVPAEPPPTIGGGGGAGGPGTAVVVEPKSGCDGDEYEVTIRFATSAIASDETEVEILIRRVGSDGSESEIELDGRLDEVGALLEGVASEGDCVEVRVEPAGEEEAAEEELEPDLP